MPGNAACMRCGASLQLSAVAISIQPPRASGLRRRLRAWFPSGRVAYPIRDGIESRWRDLAESNSLLDAAQLRAGSWPRLLIPGWAHLHEGHRTRAALFLWPWIGFALLTALTFGSPASATFAGCMIAVHAGSVIDLLWRSWNPDDGIDISAIVTRAVTVLLILLAIYLTARWVISQFIDSRRWVMAGGNALAEGDVVLFRPRSYDFELPRAGDVVLYRNPVYLIQTPGGPNMQRAAGEGLDRIIAGPGSKVHWKNGVLKVDGKVSALRPLDPQRMPSHAELEVPHGCVCIFPTTDPLLPLGNEAWMQQCNIPQHDILGQVFVRNYPFWRFSWFY
jgi:hypothetical protein